MCRNRTEKVNVVERNEQNSRVFDEMNLEEAKEMNLHGIDFECGNGRIERIIEHY